jgi:branched-chain amino acid aminotransferase
VITPVGRLVWEEGEVSAGTETSADMGSVTMRLRQALVDIQYGRAQDGHGWMRRLV